MKKIIITMLIGCFCVVNINQAQAISVTYAQVGASLFYFEALDTTLILKQKLPESVGVNNVRLWDHANNFAGGLEYNGIADWRLPTVAELREADLAGLFDDFQIQYWWENAYWSNSIFTWQGTRFSPVYRIDFNTVENAYADSGGPQTSVARKGYVDGARIIHDPNQILPVPEPATMFLLGIGMILFGMISRKV